LNTFVAPEPKVGSRTRQPWAGGQNPFGIATAHQLQKEEFQPRINTDEHRLKPELHEEGNEIQATRKVTGKQMKTVWRQQSFQSSALETENLKLETPTPEGWTVPVVLRPSSPKNAASLAEWF
jgi:hypothetical protein